MGNQNSTDGFEPPLEEEKLKTPFIKMPYDKHLKFKSGINKWAHITNILSKDIKNVKDFQDTIAQINPVFKPSSDFEFLSGFRLFIEEQLTKEETSELFNDIMPKLQKLALQLPILIPEPIPLLLAQKSSTVTLTKKQVSCLLANLFFCTFHPFRSYNTNKKREK